MSSSSEVIPLSSHEPQSSTSPRSTRRIYAPPASDLLPPSSAYVYSEKSSRHPTTATLSLPTHSPDTQHRQKEKRERKKPCASSPPNPNNATSSANTTTTTRPVPSPTTTADPRLDAPRRRTRAAARARCRRSASGSVIGVATGAVRRG